MGNRYRCLGCGREFAAQGIGPHQRLLKHEGREQTQFAPAKVPVPVPVAKKVRRPSKRQPRGVSADGRTQPGRILVGQHLITVLPIIVVEDELGGRWIMERIDG